MNKIILITAFCLVLMGGLVSAIEAELLPGEAIFTLVIDSTGSPEDAADCYISVFNSSGDMIVDSEIMSFGGNGTYYYGNTSAFSLGFYNNVIRCNSSEGTGSNSYFFEIVNVTQSDTGILTSIEGYMSGIPNLLQRLLFVQEDTLNFAIQNSNRSNYQLQISNSTDFSYINTEHRLWYSDYDLNADDLADGVYYWRVRIATGNAGYGAWSETFQFNKTSI